MGRSVQPADGVGELALPMKTRTDARRRSHPLLFLIPVLFGPLLPTSAHSGNLPDIEHVIDISVDGVNAHYYTDDGLPRVALLGGSEARYRRSCTIQLRSSGKAVF